MYGHSFISQYGEAGGDAYSFWAKGLHDLSVDEIALGIGLCVDRESAWPPNLPEFKQLCTSGSTKKPPKNGATLGVQAISYKDPYAGLGKEEKVALIENKINHMKLILTKNDDEKETEKETWGDAARRIIELDFDEQETELTKFNTDIRAKIEKIMEVLHSINVHKKTFENGESNADID